MSLGRPLARLQLEREEREQLEAMASSPARCPMAW